MRYGVIGFLLFAMLAISCTSGRTELVAPAEAKALHDTEWTIIQEPGESGEAVQ